MEWKKKQINILIWNYLRFYPTTAKQKEGYILSSISKFAHLFPHSSETTYLTDFDKGNEVSHEAPWRLACQKLYYYYDVTLNWNENVVKKTR